MTRRHSSGDARSVLDIRSLMTPAQFTSTSTGPSRCDLRPASRATTGRVSDVAGLPDDVEPVSTSCLGGMADPVGVPADDDDREPTLRETGRGGAADAAAAAGDEGDPVIRHPCPPRSGTTGRIAQTHGTSGPVPRCDGDTLTDETTTPIEG